VAQEAPGQAALDHPAGLDAGYSHPRQDRPLDRWGGVSPGEVQQWFNHLAGQVPEKVVQGFVVE
jgi:hypothetical protein